MRLCAAHGEPVPAGAREGRGGPDQARQGGHPQRPQRRRRRQAQGPGWDRRPDLTPQLDRVRPLRAIASPQSLSENYSV